MCIDFNSQNYFTGICLQVMLNAWSATGIKDAVEKGQGYLKPLGPFNVIDPMILYLIEKLIPGPVPVNAESLALIGIENSNASDELSSEVTTSL